MNEEIHCIINEGKMPKNELENDGSDFLRDLCSVYKWRYVPILCLWLLNWSYGNKYFDFENYLFYIEIKKVFFSVQFRRIYLK